MMRSLNSSGRRPGESENRIRAIRTNIAQAMIGRTVDLLAGANSIAHGVVAGVLTESGMPKLVVGGTKYDLKQLLTVTPTTLN